MSQKLKVRLALFGAIFFWLLFSVSNIYLMLVNSYDIKVDYSRTLLQIFFSLFILCAFAYYRYIITKADSLNFIDLLWRVFITGLITTLISLGIQLFFTIFSESNIVENPLVINFFYNMLIGLVVIYIISTFVVWKRLILYQKSKNLFQRWTFFEISLLLTLGFDFLGSSYDQNDFKIALIVIGFLGLVLSFNLKWIAYLNFRQKWKSILFILLSGIYLYHFALNLARFRTTEVLIIDLFDRVFIVGLIGFLFFYAIVAVLVTLFNLPTSSVFEQKLKEAIDFQRLSQSIPRGQTKDQTYELLLESSMSAVFADAAWLETKEDNGMCQIIRNLRETDIQELKAKINDGPIRKIITLNFKKEYSNQKLSDHLKHPRFKSIIALPIYVQENQIGYIVLLNEVSEAFNREMVSIITTFVNQASISLENLTLIQESIENERYREQLEIAKTVQKSLLPEKLPSNKYLEMEGFSMAADAVGGDYYDFVQINEDRIGLIVGDVSGKGTSAAFHMAQMKGIFHSLSTQDLGPAGFMISANAALSLCLEKNSFITATYFEINTKLKSLEYARAGHCPTLLYRPESESVSYLESDGMGLGILRNLSYQNYVYSDTQPYRSGDTLLLYTDGVTEAKNESNELFGNKRLKMSFKNHASKLPDMIKKGIIEDLSAFTGQMDIDDDYTIVIVKFNE